MNSEKYLYQNYTFFTISFSLILWLKSVSQFSEHAYSHIGTEEQLKEVCLASNKKWIAGIVQSRVYNLM